MEYKRFFKSEEGYHYFLGLSISDGHMSKSSRNRGNIQIELQKSDSSILKKLKREILVSSSLSERTRSSNFSDSFTSNTLRVCGLDFRNFMLKSGIPYGT